MKRSRRVVFATLLFLATAPLADSTQRQTWSGEPPLPKKITISQETTDLVAPLRCDGYVDYFAAVNRKWSVGVTPDNNAVVLVLQALGPERLEWVDADRFFQLLQIDPLPPEGDYFKTTGQFIVTRIEKQEQRSGRGDRYERIRRRLYDQFFLSESRPWDADELPQVAKWLEMNEKPLALIRQASERSRWFVPLLPRKSQDKEPLLCDRSFPVLFHTRSLARALTTRTMLRLKNGRIADAWQDTRACLRLGRLAGQDRSQVGLLLCITSQMHAFDSTPYFIANDNLTLEHARGAIADLKSLAPIPQAADVVDSWERWVSLDMMVSYAVEREPVFAFDLVPSSIVAKRIETTAGDRIKWDLVLRRTNTWFDRVVDAMKQPTVAEQTAALQVIEDEAHTFEEKCNELKQITDWSAKDRASPETLSCHFADTFLSLYASPLIALHEAQIRCITETELTLIGFALAAYRIEHGSYPPQLERLAPDYLPSLPCDPCTEQSFRYAPQGDGFLLYSVGLNQTDDGGRNRYLDRNNQYEDKPDDFCLRVPAQ